MAAMDVVCSSQGCADFQALTKTSHDPEGNDAEPWGGVAGGIWGRGGRGKLLPIPADDIYGLWVNVGIWGTGR